MPNTTEPDQYTCPNCAATVSIEDAGRREPMGDLDPHRWQMLYCPECGNRITTVLVPDDSTGNRATYR